MARAPLILTLVALTAQPAWPQPLSPGKPAGTQAAQHITQNGLFIVGSIVAVALVFVLPASSTATSATASNATTG
jgi:hypothetical protein